MANKVLLTEMDGAPAQIVFSDHENDFSPTAANDLRRATYTDVEIQLVGVADSEYRESDKCDLGENRAPSYAVRTAFEMAATPTAGEAIYLYWAPSHVLTAGTANPGGVSGQDADYTGYSSNADAAIKQLQLIGVHVCTVQVTTTVQIAECGVFSPTERYGTLVVRNESGAAFHSDDVECHVVFDPIVPEVQ